MSHAVRVTDDRAQLLRNVRKAAPDLQREALARLGEIPWFAALSADVRSWVGVVVQTGIDNFLEWLQDPKRSPRTPEAAFAAVPVAAARAVTLEQTVELIRLAVDVGAEMMPRYAPKGGEEALRATVERYGREVAFAAALVYAKVAEQRGAWDARLQAHLMDALISGTDEAAMGARASALGWPASVPVRAMAASPEQEADDLLDILQVAARRLGRHTLAATYGTAVLVVVTSKSSDDAVGLAAELLPGESSVVVGPEAANVLVAATSVHAALAGLAALSARPGWIGPIFADALLPERALADDESARLALIETGYNPLRDSGAGWLETADAVIAAGGSLEAAARAIPVHVNTLRYRLARIEEVTGFSLRDPHDRFALQVALILGRMRPPEFEL